MMKPQVLTDPAIFPTEKVLSGHLGKAGPAFRALFDFNHENFPEFVERWKYYNDGKSWLSERQVCPECGAQQHPGIPQRPVSSLCRESLPGDHARYFVEQTSRGVQESSCREDG
jgi:hypothetical protein